MRVGLSPCIHPIFNDNNDSIDRGHYGNYEFFFVFSKRIMIIVYKYIILVHRALSFADRVEDISFNFSVFLYFSSRVSIFLRVHHRDNIV